MKNKTLILVAVLLLAGLHSTFAGNENRIGTAGGQELLIATSARGAALGGAVTANSYGVDALYWNPGGFAYLEGTEVMFTHIPYIADINVEYFGIGTQIEDFGAVGLAIKVVDVGSWEETTEAFPDGTGRFFSPTLTVLGLTWARTLTNHISFGITGNLIREDIFDVAATGFSFDLGFLYETGVRGFTLGLVMKNYGPDLSFEGGGFNRESEDFGTRRLASKNAAAELPTSVNIGISYDAYSQGMNRATVGGNFRANNQAMDFWQSGFEYSYDEKYFLRAGYKYADQQDFIYGASLGAGAYIPIGDVGLTVEYTWSKTDFFDNNQFFTIRGHF